MLESEDGQVLWQPQPGKHRLVLSDAGGQELDAVMFEVRGRALVQPMAESAAAH